MLKPKPERRMFQLPPRGLADVNVSENHVWSLLLHKVILSLENFESSFLYYYNGAQKHEGFVGFENACSRAKTCVILASLNYVRSYANYCWWRHFLWRPRMRICKVQKPCIISKWISWLIHGVLPVKTWLLIACDTAFLCNNAQLMWLNNNRLSRAKILPGIYIKVNPLQPNPLHTHKGTLPLRQYASLNGLVPRRRVSMMCFF